MSVGVILRGVLAGVLAAAVLAFVLALVDYNTALAGSVLSALLWAGILLVAGVSGWVAGRGAEHAGWIHGSLAAVTLFLVGKAVGENMHLGSSSHLWLGLTVAVITGMIGGMWGASTQY